MNYELICKAVLVLFAMIGVWAVVKGRPDWLLWQYVLGLTLAGFNWYMGTLVTPNKITMGFALVYLLFKYDTWMTLLRTTRNSHFILCFVALIASLVAAYLIEPTDQLIESSGFQGTALRPLVQLYAYLTTIALFPLTLLALNTVNRLQRFCSWFVGVGLFASLVGLYHLIMIHAGREFMPILRWNAAHSQAAAFVADGVLVQRIYGFAGEPKQLAVYLMPALFLVLAGRVTQVAGGPSPWWSSWWVMAVLGVALVFCFSTAAFIALPIGFFILGRVVALRGLKALGFLSITLLLLFLMIQGVARFASVGTRQAILSGTGFGKVLYERVIGRLSEEGDRRYEMEAWEFLTRRKPEGFLAGLGPGMYVFHLQKTWDKGVEPIDSGWVVLVLDTGLLGLSLFGVWLYTSWNRTKNSLKSNVDSGRTQVRAAQVVCMAGLVASCCANLGIPALPFVVLFCSVLEVARGLAISGSMHVGAGEKPSSRGNRKVRRRWRARDSESWAGTNPARAEA